MKELGLSGNFDCSHSTAEREVERGKQNNQCQKRSRTIAGCACAKISQWACLGRHGLRVCGWAGAGLPALNWLGCGLPCCCSPMQNQNKNRKR